MPRKRTQTRPTYSPSFRLATGLRQKGKRDFLTLDDIVDRRGRPLAVITIGRSPESHISIKDDLTVSNNHAEIWRGAKGEMRLMTAPGCKNGIFVDGQCLVEPTLLRVGMRIRMGNTHLFATDDQGCTPVQGYTLDDCIRFGKEVYGSSNAAARYLGRSPGHIRERALSTPLRQERIEAKKRANRDRNRKRKRTSPPES